MPNFDVLRRTNSTFTPGNEREFASYLDWAHAQVCTDCGRPALNAEGKREVAWVTETKCMPCFEKAASVVVKDQNEEV